MEETERDFEEPVKSAVGEITQRRHPILLAIVFIFALWLLVLPFLFFTEKSYFSEAVRMNDRVCEAKLSGETSLLRPFLSASSAQISDLELMEIVKKLPCPNRLHSKVTFQRLEKHFVDEPNTYELVIQPHAGEGKDFQRLFFVLENDTLKWMLK
jgi:hypothetical protein